MAENVWRSILGAVNNVHRRRVLMSLLDCSSYEAVTVPDDIRSGDVDERALQRQLVHTHLPKLEEEGFVRLGRDGQEVVEGPAFDEIRPFLEVIDENRGDLPKGWA